VFVSADGFYSELTLLITRTVNLAHMDSTDDDIAHRVFRVVSETFPDTVSSLEQGTMIRRDLGADSMHLISLMIALDSEFDTEFAVDQIPDHDVDLEWICRFVSSTLAAHQSTRS
jgi:acyl carrier protein